MQRNQNFSRNRRSLSGTITEGEQKKNNTVRKSTRTERKREHSEEEAKLRVEQTLGPFIYFSVHIYSSGGPSAKMHELCTHRNPLPQRKKHTAGRMRCGAGHGMGGFRRRRRRTLCEVSLGYDRLVPTLAGLLTVAKRRPKTTKRDFHSNALRQGQLFGAWGSGASSGREGGQRRETIEPRLAACDWNPELTFAFLGIN